MVLTTSIRELFYKIVAGDTGHRTSFLTHGRCKFLRLTMPKWLSWTLTLIMDVDAHLNAHAMFVHITP